MKKHHAATGMLLAGFLALTLGAQATTTTREDPKVVVGTFDSRAVAVAYVRSDAFSDSLRMKRAEVEQDLERARAAGDDERVAELEALGPAMQKRIYDQGFGSAPVDEIIERIADELPRIAAEAGVDVIVSKWVLAYSGPKARFVDVTDRLAAEFDPDEETLKVIEELLTTEPVPLEELDHDH